MGTRRGSDDFCCCLVKQVTRIGSICKQNILRLSLVVRQMEASRAGHKQTVNLACLYPALYRPNPNVVYASSLSCDKRVHETLGTSEGTSVPLPIASEAKRINRQPIYETPG